MTPLETNDLTVILLLAGVLFVHASYQLSVSVLSYMSGHALGQRSARKRLASLGIGYSLGVASMIFFILVSIVVMTSTTTMLSHDLALKILTIVVAAIVPLVGLFTVLTYYRQDPKGTRLWLPRQLADYLLWSARKTKSPIEATSLGAATVVGELPFILAPLLIMSVIIAHQPLSLWLGYSALYAILASLPVFIITGLLSTGTSPAAVQRWREQNKKFLQWTSGILLIILTIFLVVLQIGVPK